jgi:hypothetical protein
MHLVDGNVWTAVFKSFSRIMNIIKENIFHTKSSPKSWGMFLDGHFPCSGLRYACFSVQTPTGFRLNLARPDCLSLIKCKFVHIISPQ